MTAWGPGSGPHDGELVAVNLGEVVGHHQQSPLEAHLGAASSVEAVDAAVVLGVAEQRLDGLFALSIPLMAVLCASTLRIHDARPEVNQRLGVARVPLSGATSTAMCLLATTSSMCCSLQ